MSTPPPPAEAAASLLCVRLAEHVSALALRDAGHPAWRQKALVAFEVPVELLPTETSAADVLLACPPFRPRPPAWRLCYNPAWGPVSFRRVVTHLLGHVRSRDLGHGPEFRVGLEWAEDFQTRWRRGLLAEVEDLALAAAHLAYLDGVRAGGRDP